MCHLIFQHSFPCDGKPTNWTSAIKMQMMLLLNVADAEMLKYTVLHSCCFIYWTTAEHYNRQTDYYCFLPFSSWSVFSSTIYYNKQTVPIVLFCSSPATPAYNLQYSHFAFSYSMPSGICHVKWFHLEKKREEKQSYFPNRPSGKTARNVYIHIQPIRCFCLLSAVFISMDRSHVGCGGGGLKIFLQAQCPRCHAVLCMIDSVSPSNIQSPNLSLPPSLRYRLLFILYFPCMEAMNLSGTDYTYNTEQG